MRYREFGDTGLEVSELAFGGWAIGGQSFGSVDRSDALRALARAEELGVNLVDTAGVYGSSEEIIGRFLEGRRDRWIVATKYSGQSQGLTALAEDQLRRLKTTWIDFYQIHWVPSHQERYLYDELRALKEAGKVRFVGVSLYSEDDIDDILDEDLVDGIQVAVSLLDPRPLVNRVSRIRENGLGVLARSCLKAGFLTGKYGPEARFTDPDDQRSDWSPERIAETAEGVERFRFLEEEAGSMLDAAISYPLGFSEVSSVLLSTKSEEQASANYGRVSPTRFSPPVQGRIEEIQDELGLLEDPWLTRLKTGLRRTLSRAKRMVLRGPG